AWGPANVAEAHRAATASCPHARRRTRPRPARHFCPNSTALCVRSRARARVRDPCGGWVARLDPFLSTRYPSALFRMLGLLTPTDPSWVDAAEGDLAGLLSDHAHCELKAASNALGLIGRFGATHPAL